MKNFTVKHMVRTAVIAALYAAIAGRNPLDRPYTPSEPTLPEPLFDMLERMLSTDPAIRFQSVFDLRYAAYALDIPTVAPAVTEAELTAWRAQVSRKRAVSRKATNMDTESR